MGSVAQAAAVGLSVPISGALYWGGMHIGNGTFSDADFRGPPADGGYNRNMFLFSPCELA